MPTTSYSKHFLLVQTFLSFERTFFDYPTFSWASKEFKMKVPIKVQNKVIRNDFLSLSYCLKTPRIGYYLEFRDLISMEQRTKNKSKKAKSFPDSLTLHRGKLLNFSGFYD